MVDLPHLVPKRNGTILMAINLKFSLLCDEVRIENNGKVLILGVYTPDMAVPQFPIVVPVLTFLFWLEGTIPGSYQFQARLVHLETGSELAQAMGAFGLAAPGVGLAPIRLQGLQFKHPGPYAFILRINNEPEIMHHFSVLLPPGTGTVQAHPGMLPPGFR
jgi:hypothetical protein